MADLLFSVLHMLLAIFWVHCAVKDFMKPGYSFPIDIMCAVWSTTFMILHAIEWYSV